VRFDDVAARIRALPSPLPAPADGINPELVSGRLAGGPESPWVTPRVDDAGLTTEAYRPSAVLVLVFPDETGEARVLLTARPERDIRHPGQIAFPGGATDPDDRDPVATALREAREEVGLDEAAAGVEVVGLLDPVTIPVSRFRLVPVVALAARRPVLTPDPREVRAVFDVAVDRFLPGSAIEMVERDIGPGVRIRYGAFDVDGYRIWGATARILGQLGAVFALDVAADAGAAPGSARDDRQVDEQVDHQGSPLEGS
jgi:8-oxo-dGTP pyrophosphatase MutT (NUDIX family)